MEDLRTITDLDKLKVMAYDDMAAIEWRKAHLAEVNTRVGQVADEQAREQSQTPTDAPAPAK